jgi:hypothetical protein
MHVLSMTPEQLSSLPLDQRNTYMQVVSSDVDRNLSDMAEYFIACYAWNSVMRHVYPSHWLR